MYKVFINNIKMRIKDYKYIKELKVPNYETKLDKVKRIFIYLCKCIISVDTSQFNNFTKTSHAFWSNKWIFVRLFSGLIEFKFHLTNYAHSEAWYYGTGVRFRISICGVFKSHLIFNIGPWANEY